jgi:hypothetical protein
MLVRRHALPRKKRRRKGKGKKGKDRRRKILKVIGSYTCTVKRTENIGTGKKKLIEGKDTARE